MLVYNDDLSPLAMLREAPNDSARILLCGISLVVGGLNGCAGRFCLRGSRPDEEG